ncbi:MAG: GNAT family N-acetyltransferase [Erysipelotrichaceae bacterium]|nr:GNAT family N-acetyltransferase [Erysipelotrichaceae bacterium]
MQFKKGLGWKACYDEKRNIYTAERSWRGFYQLCEIDKETFDKLGTDAMGDEYPDQLISRGRHLVEADDDYYTSPYVIIYDEDFAKIAPWSDAIRRSGYTEHVASKELTDYVVEHFASEEKNREYRRKKAAEVSLRDMKEEDIEDYVRWFTTETTWSDWDAPWEPLETDEDQERKSWTEYYESVRDMSEDALRRKFEIEVNGRHIGWVSSYYDLGYVENTDNIPAIGIDIPNEKDRHHGYGTRALQLFIDYLKEKGHTSLYTQTWSGNTGMMRVAEKLGFKEAFRKENNREVNGRKYDSITYRLDL